MEVLFLFEVTVILLLFPLFGESLCRYVFKERCVSCVQLFNEFILLLSKEVRREVFSAAALIEIDSVIIKNEKANMSNSKNEVVRKHIHTF